MIEVPFIIGKAGIGLQVRYTVRIGVRGKRVFVGAYKKLDEAVKARENAELKY
jgi:hypothetical protein